jgi:hypothetical protein
MNGNCGSSQLSQASSVPFGLNVGDEKKSCPEATIVGSAEPSAGSETSSFRTSPSCRSRTHVIVSPTTTPSAYRRSCRSAGSGVTGRGSAPIPSSR